MPGPNHSKENSRRHTFKQCSACGETKSCTEFHKVGQDKKYRAGDPRRYRSECAVCFRSRYSGADPSTFPADRKPRRRSTISEKEAKRRKRESNKVSKARIRTETRMASLKWLAEQGCEECGERDPRVLEFDHLDPSKKSTAVATLISGGYAWSSEVLRREIRKCRILCANCHRKHTIEQQDYYSQPDVRRTLDAILRDIDSGE